METINCKKLRNYLRGVASLTNTFTQIVYIEPATNTPDGIYLAFKVLPVNRYNGCIRVNLVEFSIISSKGDNRENLLDIRSNMEILEDEIEGIIKDFNDFEVIKVVRTGNPFQDKVNDRYRISQTFKFEY